MQRGQFTKSPLTRLSCYLPYEVLTMAAESRLFEESRHEAVILDHVDILLLESTFPAADLLSEKSVGVAGPEGVLARVVLLLIRHGICSV